MSWKLGFEKKFFHKLKTKIALYHVVLTAPKSSTEKIKKTVVEMQQLPGIEKNDSKEEILLPKMEKS